MIWATNRQQIGKLNYNDMDRKVRLIVRYFNEHGIPTLASCAGHDDKGGFITFGPNADQDKIVSILGKFGITATHFENREDYENYCIVSFPPLKPCNSWQLKLMAIIWRDWRQVIYYFNYTKRAI